jgi:hypothetical protein
VPSTASADCSDVVLKLRNRADAALLAPENNQVALAAARHALVAAVTK